MLASNFLLFADDMKLFARVTSPLDMLYLQGDIDSVCSWCLNNDMSLNIDKCCFMRFNRAMTLFPYQYSISNNILKEVFIVKDLGVHLDTKLTFSEYCEKIICKANKMLGQKINQEL